MVSQRRDYMLEYDAEILPLDGSMLAKAVFVIYFSRAGHFRPTERRRPGRGAIGHQLLYARQTPFSPSSAAGMSISGQEAGPAMRERAQMIFASRSGVGGRGRFSAAPAALMHALIFRHERAPCASFSHGATTCRPRLRRPPAQVAAARRCFTVNSYLPPYTTATTTSAYFAFACGGDMMTRLANTRCRFRLTGGDARGHKAAAETLAFRCISLSPAPSVMQNLF